MSLVSVISWLDALQEPLTLSSPKRKRIRDADNMTESPTKRQAQSTSGPDATTHILPFALPKTGALSPPHTEVWRSLEHGNAESSSLASLASSVRSSQVGSDVSRKRRRGAGSPSKQLVGFRHAAAAVEQREIGSINDLSKPVYELAKRLKQISLGSRVLPDRCRPWLSLSKDDADFLQPEAFFFKVDEANADECATEPATMTRIVHHAERCFGNSCSEASWNSKVHSTLLDEAVNGSKHKAVLWENITTAAIEPQELIPELSGRERVPSKKADFAIALILDKEVENELARQGITPNQTAYTGVLYNPLVVSIETKAPGIGDSQARLQLVTWASAQVSKLRELLTVAASLKGTEERVVIPPLPLVIIEGHQWRFACLEVDEVNAQLWSGLTFGSTASLAGGYQIIAGLQFLIGWAQSTYRPWFQQSILNPITQYEEVSDDRQNTSPALSLHS